MQPLSSRQELRRAFKRIERELPHRLAAGLRWLRHPESRLLRIPAGIGLIAADIPIQQRPMARFALWCLSLLDRFRSRRKPD